MRAWARLARPLLFGLAVVGCGRADPKEHVPVAAPPPAAQSQAAPSSVASAASVSPKQDKAAPFVPGDVDRGSKLLKKYECNRCHEGAGMKPAPRQMHCTSCHEDIVGGRFSASTAAKTDAWRNNVAHLQFAPTFVGIERLSPSFIEGYLMKPRDLRPRLESTMPRLALSVRDAKDIATFLGKTEAKEPGGAAPWVGGDASKGKVVFKDKGCSSCHVYSGVGFDLDEAAEGDEDKETRQAVVLAPDLRFARQRLKRSSVIGWLLDPQSVKKGTLMPQTPMTDAEVKHLAAFVMEAELTDSGALPVVERLAILTRRVTFAEVRENVFGRTCHHCHLSSDIAMGDGGPGNTGGFGFPPRRLDLSDYEGVISGLLDKDGQRQSAFRPLEDGTPLLVASLLARQAEVAGHDNPAVRGMPLGLPPLSPEQIQLVETWVAQGRPR